jgi:hypothetical protein
MKTLALNPIVPQSQPRLLPTVISLNEPKALEYKRGFKNPKEDFPFAK